MANFAETDIFPATVVRKATDTAVLGGGDAAPANVADGELVKRTRWLYNRLTQGGIPTAASYTSNMNSLTNSGFFYVTSAASNRPGGTSAGYALVISDGAPTPTVATQIFFDAASDRIWRRRVSGTPTAWVQVQVESLPSDEFTVSSFLNGWSAGVGSALIVSRVGRVCHLRGTIVGGETNLPVCASLPAQYRPSEARRCVNMGNDEILSPIIGTIAVNTAGEVQWVPGGSQVTWGTLYISVSYHL